MVTLQFKSRGRSIKGLPQSIDIDTSSADAAYLFDRLSKATGLSKHRLRLNYDEKSTIGLRDGKGPLENYGLKDGTTILVKDLGLQIGWRTVFVIEYLGPLIIHPLFYLTRFRTYLYPHIDSTIVSKTPLNAVQSTIFYMVMLHFLKREFETMFVHRFSADTMPFSNVFRNSGHYWISSGVLIAWPLYHPINYTHNVTHTPLVMYLTCTVWALAEFCNLKTHFILSSLRPVGTTKRGIPHGFGFDTVTCPNYGWEILGWFLIFFLSGWNLFVGFFFGVATYMMYIWAIKKEKRYRTEFEGVYKRKSWRMIPFLL